MEGNEVGHLKQNHTQNSQVGFEVDLCRLFCILCAVLALYSFSCVYDISVFIGTGVVDCNTGMSRLETHWDFMKLGQDCLI